MRPTPPDNNAGHIAPKLGIRIYMALQPVSRTAPDVTTGTGEPLPHLLTFTPTYRGRYFLLRYYTLADISFSGARRPVLSGLSSLPHKRKGDRMTYYYFKYTNVAPYPYSRNEASWYLKSGYFLSSFFLSSYFNLPLPTP